MAFLFSLLCLPVLASAQTISTNTPLPPLQWISLTPLLQGTDHPPPLKDAAMGYDEISRSVIIFGGESENGFPQAQTFLLNLQSLLWSTPSPPSNLQKSPPARSAMISAVDFAASNRHGFVVAGGKGSDGTPLSDVWEFDFINQFWSQVQLSPGGPSARWGAVGGADIRTSPIQDSVVPGPNNTIYLAGGFDGTSVDPLSDLWRLNISGTLSSNLPDDSRGSWEKISIDTLPSRLGNGGTVINQHVISTGGCSIASIPNNTCAQQDSFVINAQLRNSISPGACPAPRLSPAVVPNLNAISTSFTSQAFMLLGTFNTSLWNDDGGLVKGEIAVIDSNTGSWSRVLPSGDPGTSGKISFPTPREGAAAVSFPQSLVGQSRNFSDTIVFGGRDANGNYLSDVWLLRAYPGSITPSSPKWSGFGNGQLQTGVDADGSGVEIQYLSSCVSAISPKPTSSTSSTSRPSPTNPTSDPPLQSPRLRLDASFLHKLLAPLSVAIFLPIILFHRIIPEHRAIWSILSVSLAFAAYGIGIAGLVLSFTTLSSTSSLVKRSQSNSVQLKTAHGRAGLALFLCFYVVAPGILLLNASWRRIRTSSAGHSGLNPSGRDNSIDHSEKLGHVAENSGSTPHSVRDASPPASPRPRTLSWGPSSLWRRSHEGAISTDSESITSAGPTRGFEVVNRPTRTRHLSNDMTLAPLQTRSLGEIDWLLRRRSLSAVNELDYAISQAHHAQLSATNTGDALVTPASTPTSQRLGPMLPNIPEISFHVFVHGSILGLCILTLVALWQRASRALFGVFLAWTVLFYLITFVFAWRGNPHSSILSVFFSWLRNSKEPPLQRSAPSLSPQAISDRQPGYTVHGPYVHHRPPYSLAPISPDQLSVSYGGARSAEDDGDDPDIDDDTRQRMIEEEIGRRDVSIITVPKRKLWVANPS